MKTILSMVNLPIIILFDTKNLAAVSCSAHAAVLGASRNGSCFEGQAGPGMGDGICLHGVCGVGQGTL